MRWLTGTIKQDKQTDRETYCDVVLTDEDAAFTRQVAAEQRMTFLCITASAIRTFVAGVVAFERSMLTHGDILVIATTPSTHAARSRVLKLLTRGPWNFFMD